MFKSLNSLFWVFFLKGRGISVGRNVKIYGKLKIHCRENATLKNIMIEDNVEMEGIIYIRIRGNGKIIVGENTRISTEVWLVSANEAELRIGKNCIIGSYCILNGGHGINIGDFTKLAGFVYINSSGHSFRKGELIQKQGYVGAPILLGRDNWVGGHSFINEGVNTGEGVVIAAGSVVRNNFGDNLVIGGNPAKVLKERI